MARVTLSPDLPPQTNALKRFEKSITELNRFYWTFRCSLLNLLKDAEGVERIPELIPRQYASKLNVSSAEFREESPETERVARHSFLVLAVTSFEDYLKDILTSFLIKNWKPEKTYKLAFKPEDIPSDPDIREWLKSKSIQATVDEFMGRPYGKRLQGIIALLNDHGANPPSIASDAQTIEQASRACEARNCIVHSSAVIDARAKFALSAIIPGMEVGQPLDISEELLWTFLAVLRDAARSIDVQVRQLT